MTGRPRDRAGAEPFGEGLDLDDADFLTIDASRHTRAEEAEERTGWAALPDKVRRRDLTLAEDAIGFCDEIADDVSAGLEAFIREPRSRIFRSTQMSIVNMAEAFAEMSPEFRDLIDDPDVKAIIGMRHRLAHAYGNVNRRIVWDTAVTDIPRIRSCLVDLVAPTPRADSETRSQRPSD